MKPKQCTLGKLFRAYDKAWCDLVNRRDKEFPVGTKVRSRLDPDCSVIVTDGSLYADHINTAYGHMSWRYLDRVDDSNDEVGK